MDRIEINVITGEQRTVELTAEEVAQAQNQYQEWLAEQPTKEEQYQENQISLRDEQLRKNQEQTANYQRLSEDAMSRDKEYYQNQNKPMQTNQNTNYQPQPSSPAMTTNSYQAMSESQGIDPYILELSQPNYNAPFDVIPLPSKGKLYKSKKANIKLAYMTTADENILTSPNLLKSGQFLEILINRKILEQSTAYGWGILVTPLTADNALTDMGWAVIGCRYSSSRRH
jgi:hypothetical protein